MDQFCVVLNVAGRATGGKFVPKFCAGPVGRGGLGRLEGTA